jgi:hypothetical protein
MEHHQIEGAAHLAVNSVCRHVERQGEPDAEQTPLRDADVRPGPRCLDAPAADTDLRNVDREREIERVPDDVQLADPHVSIVEKLEVAVRKAEVHMAGDLQIGPGPFQAGFVHRGKGVDGGAEDLLERAFADGDDEVGHRSS